jgi:cathepsin L
VLLALVVVSCVIADSELRLYNYPEYVKAFGKIYSKEEYHVHEHIFEVRVAEILHHNSLPNQRYLKGINKFTDMTDEEFKSYRGYNPSMSAALFASPDQPCVQQPLPFSGVLPESVDWRTAKPAVLTPVKDQGQCGSCWAFATTETIESQLSLATKGNLTVLSPQNVVSCTPNPDNCGGSGGCGGAIAELGFTYVKNNGIATEANWPYKDVSGQCDEASHTKVATVAGCVKLAENNYTDLLTAVATIGPIAVSVDASTWNSYSKGIYDGCDKEKNMDIDHAVQLVGYGTEGGSDYWIVRNSWGPNWGENGYIRLLRHSDGSDSWCKSDVTPSDGSGCDGGPSTITVCGDCGIWYDSSYPTGAKYM